MHACGDFGFWRREYCLNDLDSWIVISIIMWSLVSKGVGNVLQLERYLVFRHASKSSD